MSVFYVLWFSHFLMFDLRKAVAVSVFRSASVVIGAPKANTSQKDITEGGSVFYCPWSLSQSRDCHTIEFDKEGKTYDWNKSKQHSNLVFEASVMWDLLSCVFFFFFKEEMPHEKLFIAKLNCAALWLSTFVLWFGCLWQWKLEMLFHSDLCFFLLIFETSRAFPLDQASLFRFTEALLLPLAPKHGLGWKG